MQLDHLVNHGCGVGAAELAILADEDAGGVNAHWAAGGVVLLQTDKGIADAVVGRVKDQVGQVEAVGFSIAGRVAQPEVGDPVNVCGPIRALVAQQPEVTVVATATGEGLVAIGIE